MLTPGSAIIGVLRRHAPNPPPSAPCYAAAPPCRQAMIDWLQLWFHPERATPGEGVPDLISAALPMWAGLITTELLVSNSLGKKRYNLRQSISNLSAGLLALMFMGEARGSEGGACSRRWAAPHHPLGVSPAGRATCSAAPLHSNTAGPT